MRIDLNLFDAGIIHFLNQFAQRSWTFDDAVFLISANSLLKGGPIIAVFWWVWFRQGTDQRRNREILLCGISASFFALLLARVLAFALPFRERPVREPALHFQLPYGIDETRLIHWSSFPSDHAVLFFAIAATIFFVMPRAGWLSFAHTFFVICLPRIYLGMHYPSDIFVGALIGIGVASLSQIAMLRGALTRGPMHWLDESPGVFYGFLFLLTFQVATLFDALREILGFMALIPKPLLLIVSGILVLVVAFLEIRQRPPLQRSYRTRPLSPR